jgi:diguanylate cyclase (GGDEF)-like protein
MQISSKIAISISLVVAVVGALGSGVALEGQESERIAEFADKNREAVELLAVAVAPAVAEGRHERVQAILDNIHNFADRFPDVVALEVIDDDGRIVASLDPTRYNERLEGVDRVERVEMRGRHLHVSTPVRLEHHLGVIQATFSQERLDASVSKQKWAAVGLLATMMLVAGLALHLVHRRLVAWRLARLATAAGEIGAGNLTAVASVEGRDEISDLGESFNKMARAIRHYTEDLEQIIAERTAELEAANRRLVELATTDQLTAVYNRRYFDEAARRALEVARRNERPLSLVLLDTDKFKTINDTWGHAIGDAVLQAVARVLRDNARKADLVARIGGEEFAILMPEVGVGSAAQAAERMRAALEAEVHAAVPEIGERRVTASFGVASFEQAGDRLEDIVTAADLAMYESKEHGRNRVTVSRRAEPPFLPDGLHAGEEGG